MPQGDVGALPALQNSSCCIARGWCPELCSPWGKAVTKREKGRDKHSRGMLEVRCRGRYCGKPCVGCSGWTKAPGGIVSAVSCTQTGLGACSLPCVQGGTQEQNGCNRAERCFHCLLLATRW